MVLHISSEQNGKEAYDYSKLHGLDKVQPVSALTAFCDMYQSADHAVSHDVGSSCPGAREDSSDGRWLPASRRCDGTYFALERANTFVHGPSVTIDCCMIKWFLDHVLGPQRHTIGGRGTYTFVSSLRVLSAFLLLICFELGRKCLSSHSIRDLSRGPV